MASVDLTRINTNMGALNTLNALRDVNRGLALHQGRLATGRRINEAADDPAGLTLATKFANRAQNIQVAMDNIGDAKNLLSVAEGGLKKVSDILGKMRAKAEQAASDTLGSTERAAIAQDLQQYAQEIDDIVEQTTWNGNKLLDGMVDFDGQKIVMQTGANKGETTTLDAAADDFGSIKVDGGALSALSTVATTDTVTAGEFAAGLTTAASTDATAATAALAGTAELVNGNYTFEFTVNNGNATDGMSVSLLDANGNYVAFASGATSMVMATGTTEGSSAATVDTGLGLAVEVDETAFDTAGTATLAVSYAREGSYSVDVDTATDASNYMGQVDVAIDTISERLQTLGSLSSRLSFKEENLATAKINTEGAFNRIMNADMALEQLESMKFNILQQTATAMLSQANAAPQSVLQLFR